MPNHGRSGRCLTCKQRRVKCDEAKPACLPCRRLGLDCGGYSKDFAFRNENRRFKGLKSRKQKRPIVQLSAGAGEPSRSLLTGADVAVSFWLVHYAGMGRSLAIARGFYETLIPAYTSQPHDSPLSLAVSAVAARVFSLWRHEDDAGSMEPYWATYTKAVASLRSALCRPENRHRPATALAVLALHLYESISAMYDNREAMPVHHHGALSMLPIAPLDKLDDLMSAYVEGFVLHSEISSAMRQKRSIHPLAYSYINNLHTLSLASGNRSSILDSIGASVVELQAEYVRILSQQRAPGPLLEHHCRSWIAEAGQIDRLLQAWAQDLPDHWRPITLTCGQDFSPSITAYQSACDIYPSCQVATLWNLWRFHRLLLHKVIVGAAQLLSAVPLDWSAGNKQLFTEALSSAAHVSSIQGLIDGICRSVPFYLGNRIKPSSLFDFTDPEILFPSYHLLPPGDARIASRHKDSDISPLSEDDHHRHIVAYGAWHVVSPLSNLLTLVSDEYGGRLVASCLRPAQLEWIRGQFMRVSSLIRLPVAGRFGWENGWRPANSPVDLDSAVSEAEILAKQVRKGAIFMSGP